MILVTGGTGLVGAHLLLSLLKRNEQIRAIYRSDASLNKTKTIFSFYERNAEELFNKIEWKQADLQNIEELDDVVEGCSTIYHCAAMVSFHPKDAYKMYEVNVHGTRNLVDVALTHEITKFCHLSSTAAVGSNIYGEPTTEKHTWDIKRAGNYAISKKKSELEVWRGAEEGLNVVIVNPSIILGPGNWDEGSAKIVKKVADGLKYYTPGTNGFVDVRDVVRAMIELVDRDIKNERFLLVGDNLTFKYIIQTIAKGLNIKVPQKEVVRWKANLLAKIESIRTFLFGTYPLLTSESVKSAFSTSIYSNQKIKDKIGFQFTPMEETIKNTTDAYLKSEVN